MARSLKIKEEQVTKAIIKWLCSNGWQIVCYDFPQSGTGRVLHPSNTTSKTEGAFIPDIIAVKNGIVLNFENKDRFVSSDFAKVSRLKATNLYDDSFASLLKDYSYTKILYGIGMPYTDNNYRRSEEVSCLVDFIVYLNEDGSIKVKDNIGNIFNMTSK